MENIFSPVINHCQKSYVLAGFMAVSVMYDENIWLVIRTSEKWPIIK